MDLQSAGPKKLATGSSNFATEAFVSAAVAQGGGGGGSANLTNYYDKTETNNLSNAKLNVVICTPCNLGLAIMHLQFHVATHPSVAFYTSTPRGWESFIAPTAARALKGPCVPAQHFFEIQNFECLDPQLLCTS